MTGDGLDPSSPLTIALVGARPVNHWRRKVSLRGTGLRQVAEYLAQSFASLLGLESCVLYLYDRRRANLEAVATVGCGAGDRRPHRISKGSSSQYMRMWSSCGAAISDTVTSPAMSVV